MTVQYIVFGLIGLLSAYVVWLFLDYFGVFARKRDVRLGHEASVDEPLGLMPASTPDFSADSADSPFRATEFPEPRSEFRSEPSLARAFEPDASEFGFDALMEIRQTRVLLDELRRTQSALHQEVDSIKLQIAELRAATQISPIYSEAVAFAKRGYDAQAIAERCEISVAEAQLVRSLSAEHLADEHDGKDRDE